jgi:hypothetical protein
MALVQVDELGWRTRRLDDDAEAKAARTEIRDGIFGLLKHIFEENNSIMHWAPSSRRNFCERGPIYF